MDNALIKKLHETLVDLLAEERQAILEGRWESLPALLSRKETLFSELNKYETGAIPPLQELREQAQSNQRLIQSSLRGFEHVKKILHKIVNDFNEIETYDKKKRKQNIILSSEKKLEKRY